ncbi:hypothetical protein GCM10009748_23330 [Agromyces lapidis]
MPYACGVSVAVSQMRGILMELEQTYYLDDDGDAVCIFHDELIDWRYGCRIWPKGFDE